MFLSSGRFGLSLARWVFVCLAALLGAVGTATAETPLPIHEADFVAKSFRFVSGEVLAELRLHYTTLGTAPLGADRHVDNAVLVLHGTGGDGHQFLRAQFRGELFGPG